MKTKRFNLGIKIASILSAVAILSVGFANWLIVNIQPEQTVDQAGSFTVYSVENKEVTYSTSWSNANIIFGAPSDTEKAMITEGITIWFKPDSSMSSANLVATLELTITNVSELSSFDVTFAVDENDKSAFEGAIDGSIGTPTVKWYLGSGDSKTEKGTANYSTTNGNAIISMPVNASNIVGSGSNNSCTVTVEFIFSWGTDFGGVNPYVHFNNTMTYSAENAATASAAMGELLALNAMNYKVTLTPNALAQ